MRPRKRWILAAAALVALNVALWLAQGGFALPSYFFGPNMIRAEVVTKQGGAIHDYRIDRGRIRSTTNRTLTLLEKDGTVVSVPVSPSARITLGNKPVDYFSLRRGMSVTTVHEDDSPATIVETKPK